MKFERFSIYGFSVDYPVDWKVELNNKSERIKGHVAFKGPERDVIFVSWGPLEEARKSYCSPHEQAKASLSNIRKIGIKNVELIEAKSVKVNLHEASFNHVRVIRSRHAMSLSSKDNLQEEIRSLHLHCESSKRFFVIYGASPPDKSSKYANIFENMLKSFRCCTVRRRQENDA